MLIAYYFVTATNPIEKEVSDHLKLSIVFSLKSEINFKIKILRCRLQLNRARRATSTASTSSTPGTTKEQNNCNMLRSSLITTYNYNCITATCQSKLFLQLTITTLGVKL